MEQQKVNTISSIGIKGPTTIISDLFNNAANIDIILVAVKTKDDDVEVYVSANNDAVLALLISALNESVRKELWENKRYATGPTLPSD